MNFRFVICNYTLDPMALIYYLNWKTVKQIAFFTGKATTPVQCFLSVQDFISASPKLPATLGIVIFDHARKIEDLDGVIVSKDRTPADLIGRVRSHLSRKETTTIVLKRSNNIEQLLQQMPTSGILQDFNTFVFSVSDRQLRSILKEQLLAVVLDRKAVPKAIKYLTSVMTGRRQKYLAEAVRIFQLPIVESLKEAIRLGKINYEQINDTAQKLNVSPYEVRYFLATQKKAKKT